MLGGAPVTPGAPCVEKHFEGDQKWLLMHSFSSRAAEPPVTI
jgi:hypothetical protein